jgi:hypothetical protein
MEERKLRARPSPLNREQWTFWGADTPRVVFGVSPNTIFRRGRSGSRRAARVRSPEVCARVLDRAPLGAGAAAAAERRLPSALNI